MLGIQEADRSKEISTQKQKLQEYELIDKDPNEMTKRVRGEISRYLRKTNIESSRNMPRLFEDVISAYCNHNHRVEYYPAMVNLCAPFIYSVKRECDAFLCFEKMINTLGKWYLSIYVVPFLLMRSYGIDYTAILQQDSWIVYSM